MKENVLDVLMFLFENYFYDEPEKAPDRDSLEENLHQAGFSNGEIDKAFQWLDGLAEQRHQPDLFQNTRRPIRVYVESELARLDIDCRDFLMYLENIGIVITYPSRVISNVGFCRDIEKEVFHTRIYIRTHVFRLRPVCPAIIKPATYIYVGATITAETVGGEVQSLVIRCKKGS